MNETPPLSGNCSECGTALARAIVREVRHYDETQLLQVTCGGCERTSLAVYTRAAARAPFTLDDVRSASAKLAHVRSLSELFDLGDLSDAA